MPDETLSPVMDRDIRSIWIKPDLTKVKIEFDDTVESEPVDEGEASSAVKTEYKAKSGHRPHTDFIKAMKKLTKHALALNEIELAGSTIPATYTVNYIKFSGSMAKMDARIKMKIVKHIEATGKPIPIEVREVALYGDTDYPNVKELAGLVEKCATEAWEYLKGKHEGDDIQLSFHFDQQEVKA